MCERVGWWWVLAARARENFGACVEAILPFGTKRAELGAMVTAITRAEPKLRVPLLSGRQSGTRLEAHRQAPNSFFCALGRGCARKKCRPGNANSHFQLAKAYSSYIYQTGMRVVGRLDVRLRAEIFVRAQNYSPPHTGFERP